MKRRGKGSRHDIRVKVKTPPRMAPFTVTARPDTSTAGNSQKRSSSLALRIGVAEPQLKWGYSPTCPDEK